MTTNKKPTFRTTQQDKAAGRILLSHWTNNAAGLDEERAEDLAQLVAMHRAGLLYDKAGLTEYAYTRRFWHSKNNGTPARLLEIYTGDSWNAAETIKRATIRAQHGDAGKRITHGGTDLYS